MEFTTEKDGKDCELLSIRADEKIIQGLGDDHLIPQDEVEEDRLLSWPSQNQTVDPPRRYSRYLRRRLPRPPLLLYFFIFSSG